MPPNGFRDAVDQFVPVQHLHGIRVRRLIRRRRARADDRGVVFHRSDNIGDCQRERGTRGRGQAAALDRGEVFSNRVDLVNRAGGAKHQARRFRLVGERQPSRWKTEHRRRAARQQDDEVRSFSAGRGCNLERAGGCACASVSRNRMRCALPLDSGWKRSGPLGACQHAAPKAPPGHGRERGEHAVRGLARGDYRGRAREFERLLGERASDEARRIGRCDGGSHDRASIISACAGTCERRDCQ